MTMISQFAFSLESKAKFKSPSITSDKISIIIPVKDNQEGVNSFITSFFETSKQSSLPKEIIIVDNNSLIPLEICRDYHHDKVEIILTHCTRKGPASARNHGARLAKGEWLLFLDSDCIATESTITGYIQSDNKSIAYAGNVKSLGNDWLSNYYESQEILMPLKTRDNNGEFVPQYLITANCLVWKNAFDKIGGFNESIEIAGGEDVDLGLRLSQIGNLSYAFDAIAKHNFDDGLIGFWKRFIRYGKGNRIVGEIYNVDLSPKPFRPNKKSIMNLVLAKIQWLALKIGYNSD